MRGSLGAYYESEEIRYAWHPSSWKHTEAKEHFESKWLEIKARGTCTRLISEEKYPYKIGSRNKRTKFLPWSKSILMPMSQYFMAIEMKSRV